MHNQDKSKDYPSPGFQDSNEAILTIKLGKGYPNSSRIQSYHFRMKKGRKSTLKFMEGANFAAAALKSTN